MGSYAANAFFGWSPEQEAAAETHVTMEDGAEMLCGEAGLQIMTLGLKSPENIGGVLRLAGCFGVTRVHHVGAWEWRAGGGKQQASDAAKGSAPGLFFSMGERERRGMLATAKGCERLVSHASWSLQSLLDYMDAHAGGASTPSRLPLVVVETASGAQPIHNLTFPRDCVIVVGAESSGVDKRVVQRLVDGYIASA
jgi:tRNA(Leu) C34 or U34 (ribose-2'-O)-methylase TrmL